MQRRLVRGRPGLGAVVALTPAIVLTALFLALPVVQSVQLGFFDWRGYGRQRYAGLDNWRELLSDGAFAHALLRSLTFAAVTTIVSVAVGSAFALSVHSGGRARTAMRFLVFLPVVVPAAVIAAAWQEGLDPDLGWANRLLELADPDLPRAFLGSGGLAFAAAMSAAILHSSGLPMVVVLAALRDIPRDVLEAAALDGAVGWKRARHVVLPLIRPAVGAVALLQFVWGFYVFDYIYVMTHGGPGTQTEVVGTFVYRQAFESQRFGYAAAASLVAGLVLVPVSALYFVRRRRPSDAAG